MSASAPVSTPREHGGLFTIGGAALLAALVSPRPALAVASALAFAAGYLARAQVEKLARGARLRRLDPLALIVLGAIAGAGAITAASHSIAAGVATAVGALAIPAVGAVVRRARMHRSTAVELAGLAACGGSASVACIAGGVALLPAAALGVAMAGYGAAAAPLVRAEVRHRLAAVVRRRLTRVSAGALAIGAAITAALAPSIAPAFVPRGVHLLARLALGSPRWPLAAVIARECVELIAFVCLLAWLVTAHQ